VMPERHKLVSFCLGLYEDYCKVHK